MLANEPVLSDYFIIGMIKKDIDEKTERDNDDECADADVLV